MVKFESFTFVLCWQLLITVAMTFTDLLCEDYENNEVISQFIRLITGK